MTHNAYYHGRLLYAEAALGLPGCGLWGILPDGVAQCRGSYKLLFVKAHFERQKYKSRWGFSPTKRSGRRHSPPKKISDFSFGNNYGGFWSVKFNTFPPNQNIQNTHGLHLAATLLNAYHTTAT